MDIYYNFESNEKPWEKKHLDLTDYFNYGFNE